tara:strand:+ start:1164 stop:1604 length:441 start_codon:yes stop_codon:yes gene_type:complete
MKWSILLGLVFAITNVVIGEEVEPGITISVTVTNIPGAKGELLVGLYDSDENFTKKPLAQSTVAELTSQDDVTVEIENVLPGTYAIAVIQDLNENGKLDKSILGMPKEPLAFSVIKEISRGKPKFTACSFDVGDEPIEMTISMVVE